MSRHPSAVIHPEARLEDSVEVGPFAIIDAEVTIAAGAKIGGHVWLTGRTEIGADVAVHHGAVLGNAPQDLAFDPTKSTGLVIGSGTTIREYATLHRSSREDAPTRLGRACFIMAQAHVAHDAVLGDRVIVCNNSLIPGHVRIDDRVFVSGNVVVHQFCHIGTGAMIGGAAGVGQDVPPFTTIIGRSEIRALNIVGMRRSGIDAATRLEIKRVYREIFSRRGDVDHARSVLAAAEQRPEIILIRDFYDRDSRRGFCWPPARRDGEVFESPEE